MTEYQIYQTLKKLGIVDYQTFQDYLLDKIRKINVKTFYKTNKTNEQTRQSNNSNDR